MPIRAVRIEAGFRIGGTSVWKLDGGLVVEPGELELLAVASRDEATRLAKKGRWAMARSLILTNLAQALEGYLATETPPLYILVAARPVQARRLALWLAGEGDAATPDGASIVPPE